MEERRKAAGGFRGLNEVEMGGGPTVIRSYYYCLGILVVTNLTTPLNFLGVDTMVRNMTEGTWFR